MMNLSVLGEMRFWAGLEICCAAMVKTKILQGKDNIKGPISQTPP